jgi:hypothetical protein
MAMFEPEPELHENPDGSFRLLIKTRVPNACFRAERAAIGTPPGIAVGPSVLPVVVLIHYQRGVSCSQDVTHVWHHLDGLPLGPDHGRNQLNLYALLDYRLAGQSSVQVAGTETEAEAKSPATEEASQPTAERPPDPETAEQTAPAEAESRPETTEIAERTESAEAQQQPEASEPEQTKPAEPRSLSALASGFAAQDFRAWTRGPAGAAATLVVAGILLAPTAGYRAALTPAEDGPPKPGVLVLDMAIVASQGHFAAAPTEIPVRFETALPGGAAPATVKIRIPVATDLELPVGEGN